MNQNISRLEVTISGFFLYESFVFNRWINLYGSIIDLKKIQGLDVKWLDIKSLFESYLHHLGKGAVIVDIHYFTALQHYATKEDPDKVNRHVSYVKCLTDTGIQVHYGRFKPKRLHCKKCKGSFSKMEENEGAVIAGHIRNPHYEGRTISQPSIFRSLYSQEWYHCNKTGELVVCYLINHLIQLVSQE